MSLNNLREFFVFKRLQSGNSSYHVIPTFTLDDKLVLKVTYPETQSLKASKNSKENIIDSMVVAVNHAHALRILHRAISIDAFYEDDKCIKLANWKYATFNPNNTSYSNAVNNLFKDPSAWHIQSPHTYKAESDTIMYGFDYDMWCLGVTIFELVYGVSLFDEVDIADFTDEWIATWIEENPMKEIQNASVYKVVLKLLLTTGKIACSYAIKNICDGPKNDLFDRFVQSVIDEQKEPGSFYLIMYEKGHPLDFRAIVKSMNDNPQTTFDTLLEYKSHICTSKSTWFCDTCGTIGYLMRYNIICTKDKKTTTMHKLFRLANLYSFTYQHVELVYFAIELMYKSITSTEDLKIETYGCKLDTEQLLSCISMIANRITHLRLAI